MCIGGRSISTDPSAPGWSGSNGNPLSYDEWVAQFNKSVAGTPMAGRQTGEDLQKGYSDYISQFPSKNGGIPLAPPPSGPGTFNAHSSTNRVGADSLRIALPTSAPVTPATSRIALPRPLSPFIPSK